MRLRHGHDYRSATHPDPGLAATVWTREHAMLTLSGIRELAVAGRPARRGRRNPRGRIRGRTG